jgi:AcrR family transcriptional regulator
MGTKERRKREKDEVRDKIMAAARVLFAAQGIEAVSMRKIAEAVEYSPTIIYSHFEDKNELLQELCREDFSALATVFRQIASLKDPVERIRQIGLAYARFGLEHPNHYRLMFMTRHDWDDEPCPEAMEHKGNPDEDGYAFLQKTVTEAITTGRFRAELTDADLVSQILWGSVHGIVALEITKATEPWLDWRPFEMRLNLLLDWLQLGMTGDITGRQGGATS